jgi:hypothetical protein
MGLIGNGSGCIVYESPTHPVLPTFKTLPMSLRRKRDGTRTDVHRDVLQQGSSYECCDVLRLEESCILGCDAVFPSTQLTNVSEEAAAPTFRLAGNWSRSKRGYLSTRPQSVTVQKSELQITCVYMFCSFNCGRVVSPPALYSRDAGFKSRSLHK